MQNDKIINLNNFEVLDENSNYVVVDGLIANTIAILNKKGYKTEYSCSGHVLNLYNEYYKQVCDISLLDEDEIKKDFPCSYIVDVNDKTFTLLSPKQSTELYIKFDKDYHFENLPKDFEKGPAWDDEINSWSKTKFDSIRVRVDLFEDGILCDFDEIQEKINKYNKILEDWANNLPDIN